MKIFNVNKWLLLGALAWLPIAISMQASSTTDDRIKISARNSHVFKTYLKDDTVEVNSKNGVVTLSGTVSDSSHKALAKGTVENLPGVTKVNNELKILGRSEERNQDGWIATKVKTTLMLHRNVNAFYTQVHVSDGAVTLQGEAKSAAQKDLTAEYAMDIEGVKSVNNQITVSSESSERSIEPQLIEKIDDASITAQVKMVLLYHGSTSALNTQVKTNDGVVKLSGKAKNSAERDLVTKLVENINGVNNVENHMTIGRRT